MFKRKHVKLLLKRVLITKNYQFVYIISYVYVITSSLTFCFRLAYFLHNIMFRIFSVIEDLYYKS